MSFRTDSINKFVDAMIESEEKFSQGIKIYDDKQTKIEKIFKDVENQINILVKNSVDKNDKPDIASLKNNITVLLKDCIKSGTEKILESGKGMSFIKDHEKIFVVSVFEKVKSGKSSLGNFIMGSEVKKLGISSYNTFNTGVNESDIWSSITAQINTYFEDNVEVQINEIINMYFKPIIKLNKDAVAIIDNAINQLSAIRAE